MNNPAALTCTGAIIRHKRIIGGRLCSGIRLHHHHRRFSIIRTLRIAKLFRLVGSLKKRFFSNSSIIAPRASSSSSSSSTCPSTPSIERRGNCRLKSLRRTNSFYAEAIADCLEFIKRSSQPAPCSLSSTSF